MHFLASFSLITLSWYLMATPVRPSFDSSTSLPSGSEVKSNALEFRVSYETPGLPHIPLTRSESAVLSEPNKNTHKRALLEKKRMMVAVTRFLLCLELVMVGFSASGGSQIPLTNDSVSPSSW